MFDLIRELINWFKSELLPFYTIPHYQRGVVLRFGKARVNKAGEYVVVQPGFHWCIPFADDVLTCSVVPTTLDLTEQTVTTRNSVELVIESSVKYEVVDAGKFLLDVAGAVEAIADMSKGIIRNSVVAQEWPAVNSPDFDKELNAAVKREANKWGLKIHKLTITSMGRMRSLRILQTQSYKNTSA